MKSYRKQCLYMLIGWVVQLLCLIVVEGFIVYEVATTTDTAMGGFMAILAVVLLFPIGAITFEFTPATWAEYRKGD